MADDSNREIRTMVLLSLPYPPLPVMAARVEQDDGRLHDDEVTTSHTFIAFGLQDAMARNDPTINKIRMERQKQVFRGFLQAMAEDGFRADVEQLYQIYCRFSLEHIATYFPPGHPIDIRFQPVSYVCSKDKCHQKMAEYMAGQSLLFEDSPAIPREEYLKLDFPTQLLACRDRLGQVVSEKPEDQEEEPDLSQAALTRCDSDIRAGPCDPACA